MTDIKPPLRIRTGTGWVVLTDYQASTVFHAGRSEPEDYAPPRLSVSIEALGPFSFELLFDPSTP